MTVDQDKEKLVLLAANLGLRSVAFEARVSVSVRFTDAKDIVSLGRLMADLCNREIPFNLLTRGKCLVLLIAN